MFYRKKRTGVFTFVNDCTVAWRWRVIVINTSLHPTRLCHAFLVYFFVLFYMFIFCYFHFILFCNIFEALVLMSLAHQFVSSKWVRHQSVVLHKKLTPVIVYFQRCIELMWFRCPRWSRSLTFCSSWVTWVLPWKQSLLKQCSIQSSTRNCRVMWSHVHRN